MTLRIKPEFNPPIIGKAEEPGFIASQEFSFDNSPKLSRSMIIVGIMEVEEEFMKKYIEVVTEEVKE